MENLNAEQVKKALECCVKVGGYRDAQICNDCPLSETRCAILLPKNALAIITSQEQRIRELTEVVKQSETAGGCEESVNNGFSPSVTELQRENERLRADTVRKMQERLKARNAVYCINESDLKVMNFVVDQIAKEILEGK